MSFQYYENENFQKTERQFFSNLLKKCQFQLPSISLILDFCRIFPKSEHLHSFSSYIDYFFKEEKIFKKKVDVMVSFYISKTRGSLNIYLLNLFQSDDLIKKKFYEFLAVRGKDNDNYIFAFYVTYFYYQKTSNLRFLTDNCKGEKFVCKEVYYKYIKIIGDLLFKDRINFIKLNLTVFFDDNINYNVKLFNSVIGNDKFCSNQVLTSYLSVKNHPPLRIEKFNYFVNDIIVNFQKLANIISAHIPQERFLVTRYNLQRLQIPVGVDTSKVKENIRNETPFLIINENPNSDMGNLLCLLGFGKFCLENGISISFRLDLVPYSVYWKYRSIPKPYSDYLNCLSVIFSHRHIYFFLLEVVVFKYLFFFSELHFLNFNTPFKYESRWKIKFEILLYKVYLARKEIIIYVKKKDLPQNIKDNMIYLLKEVLPVLFTYKVIIEDDKNYSKFEDYIIVVFFIFLNWHKSVKVEYNECLLIYILNIMMSKQKQGNLHYILSKFMHLADENSGEELIKRLRVKYSKLYNSQQMNLSKIHYMLLDSVKKNSFFFPKDYSKKFLHSKELVKSLLDCKKVIDDLESGYQKSLFNIYIRKKKNEKGKGNKIKKSEVKNNYEELSNYKDKKLVIITLNKIKDNIIKKYVNESSVYCQKFMAYKHSFRNQTLFNNKLNILNYFPDVKINKKRTYLKLGGNNSDTNNVNYFI